MTEKIWPQFSEEHDQFRALVRRFAENELAPHAAEWEAARFFPNEVFRQMGELGLLGGRYAEEVGGSGGDIWHTAVLAEELPRCRMAGLTMGVLVQSDMATPIIAEVGTAEQQQEFLAPAVRGEKVDLVEEVETKEKVSRHAKELERAKQQARQNDLRAKLAKQRAERAKQDELRAQRAEKARQAQLGEEIEQDKTCELRTSDIPRPERAIDRRWKQKK